MTDPPPTPRPGDLPRRPDRSAASRAATAEPLDLRDLANRSDAAAERPCPTCAAPARAVQDDPVDGSTTRGAISANSYACDRCGRRWRVGGDEPWPDVVVTPTAVHPD